jgi:hypothetical protein
LGCCLREDICLPLRQKQLVGNASAMQSWAMGRSALSSRGWQWGAHRVARRGGQRSCCWRRAENAARGHLVQCYTQKDARPARHPLAPLLKPQGVPAGMRCGNALFSTYHQPLAALRRTRVAHVGGLVSSNAQVRNAKRVKRTHTHTPRGCVTVLHHTKRSDHPWQLLQRVPQRHGIWRPRLSKRRQRSSLRLALGRDAPCIGHAGTL